MENRMSYRWVRVLAWIDDGATPDQGLPGLSPGVPDQGFNPGAPDQGFNPDAPGQLPVFPGFGRPGQGLPRPPRPADPGFGGGVPVRPGQGLPWPGRPADPGWGVEEGQPGQLPVFPGFGRPGQGLPRGGPYPVVEQPTDIGAHPDLPDLDAGFWGRVISETGTFSAFITDPEGYPHAGDVRLPAKGTPGEWVTVVLAGGLAWAWLPDAVTRDPDASPGHGLPGDVERPDQGLPGSPARQPK
jgi:hypothetical protein